MFCPFCGNSIRDGVKFCPECGQRLPEAKQPETVTPAEEPVYEAPQPTYQPVQEPTVEAPRPTYQEPVYQPTFADTSFTQEKKAPKAKKKFPVAIVAIIVAAVALVALVAILLVSSGIFGSPVSKVFKAASNTVAAAGKSDIGKVLASSYEQGSTELTAEMEGMGTAKVKIYTSAKKEASVIEANATYLDDDIDFTLYCTAKELALESKTLLGKKAYGLNLDKLSTNLPKSVFAPDSGSNYALPEEIYDVLLNAGNYTGNSKNLEKDAQETLKSFMTELTKSLEKHGNVKKGSSTVSFGSSSKKCSAVNVEMDAKAMLNIASDLLKWAGSDKSLKTFLKTYATEYSDLLESSGIDMEDFVEDFYDAIESYSDRIKDLKDDLEDETAQLNLAFFIAGNQLVKVEVQALEDDEELMYCSATYGPDAAAPQLIEVVYEQGRDEVQVSYTVETDTKSDYSAKLKVKGISGFGDISGTVSWDKKDGGMTVKLKQNGTELASLKANLLLNSDSLSLKLDKITDMGSDVNVPVKLSVLAKDNMPAMPDYTDVATFRDEDKLESVMEDIQGNLRNIDALSGMADMLGGLGGSAAPSIGDIDLGDLGTSGTDAPTVETPNTVDTSGSLIVTYAGSHGIVWMNTPEDLTLQPGDSEYLAENYGYLILEHKAGDIMFWAAIDETAHYTADDLYNAVNDWYEDDYKEETNKYWSYPNTHEFNGTTYTYCWFDTLENGTYETNLLLMADDGVKNATIVITGWADSEDDYKTLGDVLSTMMNSVMLY